MRRAPILATAALAATALFAGAAEAQTAAPRAGEAAGLRYLSWTGRPAPTRAEPVATRAADVRAADVPTATARRPNRVIPHGGVSGAPPPPPRGLTPAPGGFRRTLTPANAWMRPAPASEAATSAPAPAPASPPPPASASTRALPDYLPDQGGRGQPAPADTVMPAAMPSPASEAAVSAPSADPLAPRRDAPIFRLQRPGAATAPAAAPEPTDAEAAERDEPRPARVAMVVANPTDHPAVQGARYYSVHRQAGRQPDPVALPEPTYVDALAVTLTETPASQDLAQPAEPPALIRDSQGRLRAAPAAPDGDYQ